MVAVSDARGRIFELKSAPERIVSLVPSQTQLLLDLGLAERVVGRTRFCLYPPSLVPAIPIVGGTKDFRLDAIRALKPDLVLANLEENTPELLELEPEISVYTTQVRTLAEALEMIQQLGQLTGVAPLAEQMVSSIRQGFAQLETLAGLAENVSCLYLIWRRPYMTIGSDTFIHDMLVQAGLSNLWADQLRYPQLSTSELLEKKPELILLPSEPYPFKARHISELQQLCPQALIRLVDGRPFSWYGSELLQTPLYLSELLQSLGLR